METTDIIWMFPILLVYITWKRFRLSDLEFSIVVFIFLTILTILKGYDNIKEKFEDVTVEETDRNLQTLLELPGYIKQKIGEQIDGLIKDTKNQEQSNDDIVSKKTMEDDPDISQNNVVDNGKYMLLKREYLTINNIFNLIKQSQPDIYKRIFPPTSDNQN